MESVDDSSGRGRLGTRFALGRLAGDSGRQDRLQGWCGGRGGCFLVTQLAHMQVGDARVQRGVQLLQRLKQQAGFLCTRIDRLEATSHHALSHGRPQHRVRALCPFALRLPLLLRSLLRLRTLRLYALQIAAQPEAHTRLGVSERSDLHTRELLKGPCESCPLPMPQHEARRSAAYALPLDMPATHTHAHARSIGMYGVTDGMYGMYGMYGMSGMYGVM